VETEKIKEAQEWKEEIEQSIRGLVRDFEADTGLRIVDLHLEREPRTMGEIVSVIDRINMEVRL
jgi:hypothetical protein